MAGIRRTWDKEYYAQKAKDRLEYGDDFVDNQTSGSSNGEKLKQLIRQELDSNEEEPKSKAFIQARDYKLELDSKAGQVEIINPLAEDGAKAGFWCEVCKCLLKDSASYLDHLNGKKHQAALGHSMRVERADLDAVKSRLEALKRKASGSSSSTVPKKPTVDEVHERLLKDEMDKQEFKRRRKEEKKSLKSRKQQESTNPWEDEEESNADAESKAIEKEDSDNDELEMMLGFKGFGSTKKK